MKLFFAALAMFVSSQAMAHAPGSTGTITGADVNMFERDHAFAGEIMKFPVLGVFDEANFAATMTVRLDGKTVELKISMDAASRVYSGAIADSKIDAATGAVTPMDTHVKFNSAQKVGTDGGLLSLSIDGNVVEVNIKGESFANNHFHNPTYSAMLNGKYVEFKFMGEACFGYSANITMMILSSMAHISKY